MHLRLWVTISKMGGLNKSEVDNNVSLYILTDLTVHVQDVFDC